MTTNATVFAAEPSKRPVGVLIWLIVSQLLQLLSLVPWLVIAGLSVMAFDSPEAITSAQTWLFVGAIWLYPLLPIACAIIAWVCFARRRMRGALISTSLPLIIVLPLLAYLIYASL